MKIHFSKFERVHFKKNIVESLKKTDEIRRFKKMRLFFDEAFYFDFDTE